MPGVPTTAASPSSSPGAGGREVKPAAFTDGRLVTTLPVSGALRLDLGDNDAQFAYVDTAGAVLDAGTIGCKSTGDPLPPTVPRGLVAVPASASTAHLSWSPSSDQYTAVGGYTVRRNGAVVATLPAASTTFDDTGLASGKTYSWTVSAFDTSDNHSAQSRPAAATIPAAVTGSVSSRALLRGLAVARGAGSRLRPVEVRHLAGRRPGRLHDPGRGAARRVRPAAAGARRRARSPVVVGAPGWTGRA